MTDDLVINYHDLHSRTEPRSLGGPQPGRKGLNRSVMRTRIRAKDLSQFRGEALCTRSLDGGIHADGRT